MVLISDPVKRAALPPEVQAKLPPPGDLPRQLRVSGYYPHLLPDGDHICAFNITLNMADPPPLNLPVHALFQSATLVGAFGTSENENGPADTLGGAQGDPNSPNGENSLVSPQYWPQQGIEITDGLRINGKRRWSASRDGRNSASGSHPGRTLHCPQSSATERDAGGSRGIDRRGLTDADSGARDRHREEDDPGRASRDPAGGPHASRSGGGAPLNHHPRGSGRGGNVSLAGSFGWSQTTERHDSPPW